MINSSKISLDFTSHFIQATVCRSNNLQKIDNFAVNRMIYLFTWHGVNVLPCNQNALVSNNACTGGGGVSGLAISLIPVFFMARIADPFKANFPDLWF